MAGVIELSAPTAQHMRDLAGAVASLLSGGDVVVLTGDLGAGKTTFVQGAAMAVFFIPLITLALSGLTPDRIPAASGLFNFTRITAGSFGTSITTTLWERRASLHHAQLGDHITNVDPSTVQALAGMQAGGMSPQQSYAALDRMLDQQAFMLSANDIFYVSALVFVLLIAVVWLARQTKDGHAQSATAAAH